MKLDAHALDHALAMVVPDARDRAFVLRAVLEEGPRHHRVASWALLRMLALVLETLDELVDGDADVNAHDEPNAPLRMRVPPSVAELSDDAEFPIGIPTRMLKAMLDASDADLAVECLSDGPPHHALANATMAWLIEAMYARIKGLPPKSLRPGSGA